MESDVNHSRDSSSYAPTCRERIRGGAGLTKGTGMMKTIGAIAGYESRL